MAEASLDDISRCALFNLKDDEHSTVLIILKQKLKQAQLEMLPDYKEANEGKNHLHTHHKII